jgi:hypothetical protein
MIAVCTGSNWKVLANSGHEFPIQKQEKLSITTCVRKYFICELWLKEYWKCMMVLRHILAVMCEMFFSSICHDRQIDTGGPTAWSPTWPVLNPLDCYLCGHLKSLVYAAPVDNEEALHHRTADACQTIRNYPGIFARMLQSMMRRVEACTESHGGHFEHFSYNLQIKCFWIHVAVDNFSGVYTWNSHLKFVHIFQLHSA